MTYPWETEEAKKKLEIARGRYMDASETRLEDATFPAVPGHCVWCGKPVPRKNQRFCPGVWEDVGYPLRNLYPDGKRRVYHCTNAFMDYWSRIPRFKRVVFLRDNFTCKACGARPTWTNEHGVVLPDLGQLACDHIHPFSKGGKTELKNLQTLCRKCNAAKGDKTDWKPDGEVTLDELFQIWAAEKVARDAGCQRFSWERGDGGGLIISMGRTNDNTTALSSEGRGPGG